MLIVSAWAMGSWCGAAGESVWYAAVVSGNCTGMHAASSACRLPAAQLSRRCVWPDRDAGFAVTVLLNGTN